MNRYLIAFVAVLTFMLIPGVAPADDVHESFTDFASESPQHSPIGLQTIRISYNLQLVTSGAGYYYRDTGIIPSTVNEVYQAGWLPSNLVNPLTGQAFNYNASVCDQGDVVIRPADSFFGIVATLLTPTGTEATWELDYARYTYPSDRSAADLRLSYYQSRVSTAFMTYWRLYEDIPGSINDLTDAGLWPFDGSELNPVTNQSLEFFSGDTGNLQFKFEVDRVLCVAHFEDGTASAVGSDREFYRDFSQF